MHVCLQTSLIDIQWEDETLQKSERPELNAARVVISGTGVNMDMIVLVTNIAELKLMQIMH